MLIAEEVAKQGGSQGLVEKGTSSESSGTHVQRACNVAQAGLELSILLF
jgi:hypothetical protein